MNEININNDAYNKLSKTEQRFLSQLPFLWAWEMSPEVKEKMSRITGTDSLQAIYQGTIGEILRASNKVN